MNMYISADNIKFLAQNASTEVWNFNEVRIDGGP